MFEESHEGKTFYCFVCERQARGQSTKRRHTCGKTLSTEVKEKDGICKNCKGGGCIQCDTRFLPLINNK